MSEGLKRAGVIVSIVASCIAGLSILVGGVVWLSSMSASMESIKEDVDAVQTDVTALRQDVRDLREQRWTRPDHDQWVRDEFSPLKNRVRELEQKP